MYIIPFVTTNCTRQRPCIQLSGLKCNPGLISAAGLRPLAFTLSCTFSSSRSLLDTLRAGRSQSKRCNTLDSLC